MKDTSFFSVPCVSEFTNITRLLHCAHMVGNHSHRNQVETEDTKEGLVCSCV